MIGTVRGAFTVAGAGIAGLLIWISTQIGQGTAGGYWAVYGLVAGAGLTMALSQLFGGWTKWGVPRISLGVFLIGFLPVLLCAGWVLLAGQPDANWFQRHIVSWSGHAGITGLVDDLRERLAVLAFGLGLVFGLTFDTTGPVVEAEPPTYPVAAPRDDDLTAVGPVDPPAQTQTPPVHMPPAEEREREPA